MAATVGREDFQVQAVEAIRAVADAVPEAGPLLEKIQPEDGVEWHYRHISFEPEKFDVALAALVGDVKRLGIRRFVKPEVPMGGVRCIVIQNDKVALRISEQIDGTTFKRVFRRLDVIGAA